MDVPGFALITGAASGIGRACAATFARDGAAGIALLDVNRDSLLAVKAEIDTRQTEAGQNPCRVEVYTVDVTNEDQVNSTVGDVAHKFGRLDYGQLSIIPAEPKLSAPQGGAPTPSPKPQLTPPC